jgi:hypothetical protein
MLGNHCNQCCGPCKCLPPAITISFSGMPTDGIYITKAIPPPTVTFSVPGGCSGSGAAATATVTGGGYANEGFPVTKVSLTSGGANYAQLARVAPPLPVISGGSGTGAVFTPTLAQQNECGVPYWVINSVSVTGTTQGYVSGESLSVSMPAPGTTGSAASITVNAQRFKPTLGIGGNADCKVNLEEFQQLIGYDPQTFRYIYAPAWRITSVDVINGGSNYTSCSHLSITLPPGTGVSQNGLVSARVNGPPTATVSVASASGSGASLSVTFAEDASFCRSWSVASVSIANGGAGYGIGDPVTITSNALVGVFGGFAAQVSGVSGSGEILAVSISRGGQYFARGPLASVVVESPGAYWGSGSISGVNVKSGGKYWATDKSASPYVSTVTVEAAPCQLEGGTPATLAATIDTNTNSPTFGQITGVTIENGGNCYRAFSHELANCGTGVLNGKTYKIPGNGCFYSGCRDGFQIVVEYKGESEKPVVFIRNLTVAGACYFIPLSVVEEPPFSCGGLEFTISHPIHSAVNVTVSAAENDLFTIEQAVNAESIEIEVEAEDTPVAHSLFRPWNGGACYGKAASKVFSSQASGSYTLTRQGSVLYPFKYIGTNSCGDTFVIEARVTQASIAFVIGGIPSVTTAISVEEEPSPEAPDTSGCDEYDNFSEYPREYKAVGTTGFLAGSSCPGDLYETVYGSVLAIPVFPQSSDGYCGPISWGAVCKCASPEAPLVGSTSAKVSIRITGVNL